MPAIIVPTDFSSTTAIALSVAADLADKTGLEIQAVHFYDGKLGEDLIDQSGELEGQATAERKLQEFIRLNISPGSIPEAVLNRLSMRAIEDDPSDGLLEISKSSDTALIVMGASGEGVKNNGSIFYGSVAKAVSLNADCPVMLIPREAEDKMDMDRMAYSFESEQPLVEMYNRVSPLFRNHAAKTYFVHLEHDNPEVEAKKMAFLADRKNTFVAEGEVRVLEPGELVTNLAKFSRDVQLDLLIVGHRQRGPIESFFVRSNAKRLLETSNIPLLVVPIEKY